MKIAVFSDVHANAHALRAAMVDADERAADEFWHLGDVVDRGGEPDACMRLLADITTVNLAGNHDGLVADDLSLMDQLMFNDMWLERAQMTRAMVSPDALDMLRSLKYERLMFEGQVHVAHASPRDPVWEYVDLHGVAHGVLAAVDAQIVMVGHTHVPRAFRLRAETPNKRTRDHHLRVGRPVELGDDRWVLNPGSVGDPPHAAPPHARWMMWDRDANTVTWHQTEYDWHAARAIAAMPPPPEGTYR